MNGWSIGLQKQCRALPQGRFGAEMKVSLINDGPFTLSLDSDKLFR